MRSKPEAMLDLVGLGLNVLPKSIGQLARLRWLYLDDNQLHTLPDFIGQLTQLQALGLSDNQLSALPEWMRRLTQLKMLYLHGNDALGIPPEILGPTWQEVGGDRTTPARPQDIIDYYFKTREAARPLNEVKLLLVGRGGAGKSSIRDRLVHDSFVPGKKETPGIDIAHWPLDCGGERVHVHLWDFAGQEITHATHQFFLTERSVYVLVLDARADTQEADAEYWLRLIAAFGKESPILVLLNKFDEKPFAIDEHLLSERHPAIRTFIPTDCKTKRGLSELRTVLTKLLTVWEPVHELFPAAWARAKENYSEPKQPYIAFSAFRTKCAECGIADEAEQERLARILHALGIILHYGDDPRLRHNAVLDPHWVTNGVYKLLRLKEGPASDGTLTVEEAARALPGEPREMVEYLIGLMRRFELCFAVDADEQRWLVPQLLSRFQPALEAGWQTAEATRLRYRYDVLTEGLLARFIVRTHPLSEGQPRWRYGVVLEMEGARALVRADRTRNEVTVAAIGDPEARLRLVKVVREHFAHINAELPGLNAREQLEPEGHPGAFKAVKVLEADERKGGESTIETDDGTIAIDKTRELNRISAPAARDPAQPRVRLFVSYSHKNARLLDVFRTNLDLLKADGLADSWTDRLIPVSAEWDDEIRREIEEADIIVLLVSTAFLASGYIRSVELLRAIQRRVAREAEIAIVLLEPNVQWKGERTIHDKATGKDVKFKLDAWQATLPDGRCVRDFSTQQIGFNAVEAALRKLIASVLAKRRSA